MGFKVTMELPNDCAVREAYENYVRARKELERALYQLDDVLIKEKVASAVTDTTL